MIWVSILGLLWAAMALPAAIAIGRWLRSADAAAAAGALIDASWTEDVSQFLREHAVQYAPRQR